MDKNKILSYDDGSEEIFMFGDPDRTIRWNPNDMNFIDRFLVFQAYAETLPEKIRAIKGLDKMELDDNGTPIGDIDEYEQGSFERLGAEFNAELDKAFGTPVSRAAFGILNPVSPVSNNGGFVYENFLTALTPRIEASFKGFETAREKYTSGSKNRAARRANK